jgi:hypothetical protein
MLVPFLLRLMIQNKVFGIEHDFFLLRFFMIGSRLNAQIEKPYFQLITLVEMRQIIDAPLPYYLIYSQGGSLKRE